jgi:type IV pilus assembly protein PilC
MATASKSAVISKKKVDPLFSWEGLDRAGKITRGERRAAGASVILADLRRQGCTKLKVKQVKVRKGGKIKEKDLAVFTRQLATMLRAGVPLMQSLDIVGKGSTNPAMSALMSTLKSDIESGNDLGYALGRHPQYFDTLFCNLVRAGEQAGILEDILERLAMYKEKTLAVKSKVKGALFYPTAIMVVAFVIIAVIMIFVIPAFKKLFSSFGADLPAPTKIVMAMSDFFVGNWYFIFGGIALAAFLIRRAFKTSVAFREAYETALLKLPLFGDLVFKGAVARWARTLATMFAAGVPLVEALDSVAGAAGNVVFYKATIGVRNKIAQGTTLTTALNEAGLFPNMMIQMAMIGEEAGALDGMLNKVADFYEAEVDDAVSALASLMEPMIMAVLGVLIGGLVVAMYLPIFKMGSVAAG